jgi:hypothetical protein
MSALSGSWEKPWSGRLLHFFTKWGDVEKGIKSRTACGKVGLLPHRDPGIPAWGRCVKCVKAVLDAEEYGVSNG